MYDQSFTHLGKPNTGDYYEGSRVYMRAIHPRPIVSQVEIPGNIGHQIVFREDSYDPTTRIRRGRFYQSVQGFPLKWHQLEFAPYPRPAASPAGGGEGGVNFQFAAEQTASLAETLGALRGYEIKVGQHPAQTEWRIVDKEGLSDGGILYTLRSRSSFGVLPALLSNAAVPVQHAYQSVVEASLRYDPEAVVDSCRNGASRILGRHFDWPEEDLGDLATKILKEKRKLALASAASILARLHSRTKSAEQAKQAAKGNPLRPINEDDSLLAIRLFGFILQDLECTEL